MKRSLDIIADDINKLERGSIFDIGDLLIEAKAQCEHGEWLPWITRNFQWAEATAQRYMQAAKLAGKSRTVRDLKISAKTVYDLAREDEKVLPAIVNELAKVATKKRLNPRDAETIIAIGRGRGLYPNDDLSDAAALQIGSIVNPLRKIDRDIIEALRAQKPKTEAQTAKIVQTIYKKAAEDGRLLTKKERDAEKEAQALLDGPPPMLPPSIVPPEPQTLSVDDDDQSADAEMFQTAMEQLHFLRAKPLAKFTDVCTPNHLQQVIDFLNAILAKQNDAASCHAPIEEE
jgi:hypothetical protein